MNITSEQRKRLESLAQKHKLSLMVLFGSRSRGRVHAASDTDIAVLGKTPIEVKKLTSLERELRGVFHGEINAVDLNVVPPLLGGRIMRDAVLLAGSTRNFALARIRFHARYLDFKPYLEFRSKTLHKTFAL